MKKKNVHKCALSYALEQILKWGLMILAESQSEDSSKVGIVILKHHNLEIIVKA